MNLVKTINFVLNNSLLLLGKLIVGKMSFSLSLFSLTLHMTINVISIMICLSSDSYMSMFISMEVSNLFFYPILFIQLNPPSLSGIMKYFIIQVLSSLMFILGISLSKDLTIPNFDQLSNCVIILAILMKLNMFPFHGWILMVIDSIPWISFFYLTTIQKVIPLIVLSKILTAHEFGNLICKALILSAISSVILIFMSSNSNRWLLNFSSLNNLSWLTMSAWLSSSTLFIYIYLYTMTLLLVIFLFSSSFNLPTSHNTHFSDKLAKLMTIYTVSGLPPLGMFLAKLEVVLESTEIPITSVVIMTMLVLTSLITWFYSKSMMTLMMSWPKKMKNTSLQEHMKVVIILMVSMSLISGVLYQ